MGAWLEFVLTGAFLAGLAGGLHCAGMCGGIIHAVGMAHHGAGSRWRYALGYNAGRLTSYALAGALVGALGQTGLASRGGLLAQQIAWFAAGVTLMLLALHVSGMVNAARYLESAGAVVWRRLQPLSRHFLPVDSMTRAMGLGLVWGWLPCGMVYVVLLTAAATADPLWGALTMSAFGLGTLPNVLGIAWLAHAARRAFGSPLVRYGTAAVMAAVATYVLLHVQHPPAAGGDALCRPGLLAEASMP